MSVMKCTLYLLTHGIYTTIRATISNNFMLHSYASKMLIKYIVPEANDGGFQLLSSDGPVVIIKPVHIM